MAHPEGTRAWRKSHRRKWREGSTFRQVGSLAQRIVIWVEDNADDNGTVQTTTRYLAEVMSCYREPVNRMAVWRAIQSAIRVGLLAIPDVTAGVTLDVTTAMTLTRVNYKQYQDKPEPDVTPAVTLDESQAGLSGRGEQKKQKEKKGAEAPPREGWQGLIDSLTKLWQGQYPGMQLVWSGRDFKTVKALRSAIPDVEITRRFKNYLGNPDPFFAGHPVATFASQVNKFIAAPVRAAGFATAESHESFAARGGGTQSWG